MNTEIKLVDANGLEVKCDIVALFSHNNIDYIAYTDGTKTDGLLDILVARLVKDGETAKLMEVETDDEWNYIDSYIEETIFGGEEDEEI